MHGYACETRWDMDDRFLPDGKRWLAEFNTSHRAVVDCQRGFFDAFADRLTRAHWEAEWDAQPFRLAAAPPIYDSTALPGYARRSLTARDELLCSCTGMWAQTQYARSARTGAATTACCSARPATSATTLTACRRPSRVRTIPRGACP